MYSQNLSNWTNWTVTMINETSRNDHVISSENVLDTALGSVQSHLVLALAFAWILVFLGVFKGIGSIGWAVSVTSTLPYLLVNIPFDLYEF